MVDLGGGLIPIHLKIRSSDLHGGRNGDGRSSNFANGRSGATEDCEWYSVEKTGITMMGSGDGQDELVGIGKGPVVLLGRRRGIW